MTQTHCMSHAEGRRSFHVEPHFVVSKCRSVLRLQKYKVALAYCCRACVSTVSVEAMLACHDLVRVATHDDIL